MKKGKFAYVTVMNTNQLHCMCFFEPHSMEYASMLQQVATHASWVIRNDVVVDIQPDFIDLRGDNAVMPVATQCCQWYPLCMCVLYMYRLQQRNRCKDTSVACLGSHTNCCTSS